MGIFDSTPDFIDVYQHPKLGRLDPSTPADGIRDAALIRKYIRLQKQVQASAPARPIPAIGREVLLKIWEAPRIAFNEEALSSFSKRPDLRNKLLWIPWSIEALLQWQENKSAVDLVLEHVTPIEWMWQMLGDLDEEFLDPNSDIHPDPDWPRPSPIWENWAAGLLQDWWTVAVVTRAQEKNIDKYGGRTKPYQRNPSEPYHVPNPFERYLIAQAAMDAARKNGDSKPPFSTARFVLPGHATDVIRTS